MESRIGRVNKVMFTMGICIGQRMSSSFIGMCKGGVPNIPHACFSSKLICLCSLYFKCPTWLTIHSLWKRPRDVLYNRKFSRHENLTLIVQQCVEGFCPQNVYVVLRRVGIDNVCEIHKIFLHAKISCFTVVEGSFVKIMPLSPKTHNQALFR